MAWSSVKISDSEANGARRLFDVLVDFLDPRSPPIDRNVHRLSCRLQRGAQVLGQRGFESAKPLLDILPHRPIEIRYVPQNGFIGVRRELASRPALAHAAGQKSRDHAGRQVKKRSHRFGRDPVRLSLYFEGFVCLGQEWR